MPNTKTPINNTPHNETHLKKAIYKALIPFTNIYRRKISTPFRAGILDFIICFNGRVVFVESKILPNRLSPLQRQEFQEIKRSGGLAYGIFAEPDFSAFYLYKDEFNIVEYGNLTDLLKAILL